MLNVAVIDDQPIILEGVVAMLKRAAKDQSITIAYAGESAIDFLDYINGNPSSVDIAVIDFQMPEMNGIALVKKLRESHPNIKAVFFSSYYTPELIESAMAEGAKSYFKKDISYADFINALTEVKEKGYYFPDDFPLELVDRVVKNAIIEPVHNFTATFSDKEKEIAIATAKGLTAKEIGEKLAKSQRTIEEHKLNFKKKAGCTNNATIAVYCSCMGWLN